MKGLLYFRVKTHKTK